ncbi:hypothetical protein L6164_017332 [Bauhinia variegata]|uniref:Uncharacterized protein n=1 Tax=Bauhinia variegata TaxID=167791 RepID=A0ACB9N7T1_BAUVA|nr:hypothetical protein L6164_017332 [Bauhinia variegata]
MGFRNLCKKLRYLPNHVSSDCLFFQSLLPPFSSTTLGSIRVPLNLFFNFTCFHTTTSSETPQSLFSSTGSSPVCLTKYPFANSSDFLQNSRGCIIDGHNCSKLRLLTPFSPRHFSSSSDSFDGFTQHTTAEMFSELVDLIIADGSDLESCLNVKIVTLSKSLTVKIFRLLSYEKLSALRFFDWLKVSYPYRCWDPDICNLVIDNCGQLGNYEAMVDILIQLNLRRIPLGPKAFEFLLSLSLHDASFMESSRKVVDMLNQVGGLCRTSGVSSLIEMFAVSGSFHMAEPLIEMAGRKLNHYNILIREMSNKNLYKTAQNLLRVMKEKGCFPNRTSFHFVLSCLCRNGKFAEACQLFVSMEKDNVLPDALTFEIIITSFCKRGQLDLVPEFLDKMILKGIEPRLSTHAMIIKAYFGLKSHEEAHKYVIDSSFKHRSSSNANYSLLAALHMKHGNILQALKILHEMIDKGLKPNFPTYIGVRKHLQKQDREAWSSELEGRYSSLIEN